MFTEEEFKEDITLFTEFTLKRVRDEIRYKPLPETTDMMALKKKSVDEFLWVIVECYKGLKFTDNIEIIRKFIELLKNARYTRWFISYATLSQVLMSFSKDLGGQVLQGQILWWINEYLEVKIDIEILEWGGIVDCPKGKVETNKLVNIFDNIYRRTDYSGNGKVRPAGAFDEKMIGLANEFAEKTDNVKGGRNFFLQGLKGKIEKQYAMLIAEGIGMPPREWMTERKFYGLLFDLFYLIFKDIGWLSYEEFNENLGEKDSKFKNAYKTIDPQKNYFSYRVRQIKSLLKPSKDFPSSRFGPDQE